MFTTVLGSLTSLLPKNFIFGSFVPVLIFGFLNGVMLMWNPAFRDVAGPWLTGSAAFATAVLFVAAIVVSYVVSSLQNVMRGTLEGAYVPAALVPLLRAAQAARKRDLSAARDADREDNDAVRRADDILYSLKLASLAEGPRKPGYAAQSGPTHALLQQLTTQAREWEPVRAADLRSTVSAVTAALRLYDRDAALDGDWQLLIGVIDYARQEAPVREIVSYRRLENAFGDSLPAPTRIGNIAASLANYTVKRYNIDIDTFWSRLQPVLQQKDAIAYTTLLDAKTQLDFLIACWWFTVATTLLWTPVLWFAGDSWVAALVTAPLGFAAALVLYRLAATAYLSYAEFVRACIDLNRFALLRALHIALPAGIREERALWDALRRVSQFGSSVVEISYQHDGSS